jgi:hypothetical protein
MVEPGPQGRANTFPRWVVLGAVLLGAFYLPSLNTRFDFIDDGNLVYPSGPMPAGQRLALYWSKVEANYRSLGPFRPVLWAHWELAAEAFQGSEVAWRAWRLAWCMLAAGMLLWLLHELGVPRWPALLAGAVAMWGPYRNEIWTSLTLAEGVAMPYALFALVCARRAARSPRPLLWDLAGALCVLAALGCKNTYAALVPAQVFLRLAPDDLSLREGLRKHGGRALLLSLTLLAPIAHFIYFKLNWRPGQYEVPGPSLAQLRRHLSGLLGGVSIDFLGVGIGLALLVQLAARGRGGWGELLHRYRAGLGAAALLAGAGVAIYLPMNAMSGRYTMPAVWGLDVVLAVLVTGLTELPATRWRKAAWAALLIGLAGAGAAGLGKQGKFAARSRLLWQALETVERQAPPGARVAWYCGDSARGGLNEEEGVHFKWHLERRGRPDLLVGLLGPDGRPRAGPGLPVMEGEPALEVWGPDQQGVTSGWGPQVVVERYWGGLKRFECRLAQRPPARAVSDARPAP